MIFGIKRKKASRQSNSHSTALPGNQGKDKVAAVSPDCSFTGAVVTDVGCVRPNNEDNYVLGKFMNDNSADHSEAYVSISVSSGSWQFAGVFDGMGGGEMGELASRSTAQIFLDGFGHLSGTASKTETDLCLRRSFLEANNRIVVLQKEYKILGTTGTVLCTNGVEFKIYHLGDSRAYLLREHELLQLTKDQTLAQMKLEVGMYREDDPEAEADKHKLTEYIGRDRTRKNIKPVESHWIPIQTGDRVLLCSDGLYDMCTNEEIAAILRGYGTTEEKTAALVKKAIANGGEDNITCVVVTFS